MTILITGGTGNTGLKLAHLLRNASIPVLITSRKGIAPDGFPAVRFDWSDSATFSAPFEKAHDIDKIYFIGPHTLDMLSDTKPFIDLALEKGVKQWVLLGGSSRKKGGFGEGKIHEYLDNKGVDHALLRPTWFSDNFVTQYAYTIKANNEFVSATEDARIPFVASQDIAQAAFELLTTDSKELKNSEPYIIGPELLTHDEAAAILSEVVGRKITHRKLTPEELTKVYLGVGLPKEIADFLVGLQVRTANGTEEELFSTKERKHVGKKTVRELFEENKEVWAV